MIGLDTNVLVRYIMQDDPKQSPKASQLIDALDDTNRGFVSLVSVVELVWVLSACYDLKREQIAQALDVMLRTRQFAVEQTDQVLRALRVFVSSKAFDALKPDARGLVLKAAATAEARGWNASQALATSATEELRANGVKIERIPSDLELEIKRMGEKFSREWVRSVGNEANDIFVPYYLRP